MATNLKLIPRAERLLEGKITADMTDSQTTVTVDNPPLITALPSYLEIDPDSSTYRELCRVISVSSSTITLERGLNNGGTGFPHSNNTSYKFKFTSRHWEAVATALESGYLTEDSSYVFTQVSSSSFKITASSVDRTDTYTKGRKIRINGSVVAYVISSSYSNPDTTVVIDDTTVPVSITSIEISIDTKGNTDIFTDIISKNKATGAEINTGTEDAKIVTPKAIEDSNLARTTDKLSSFAATTSAELAGVVSDETGSGSLVFGTAPTLTSPVLQGNVDGWIADTDTWVYVSASTFKIEGKNVTTKFPKGTRLKFTQTTAKYAVVTASSFSTDTTVTIAVNTNYTIDNATITSPNYSYQENPQGYPDWFSFTPSIAGSNFGNTATITGKYRLDGRTCYFRIGVVLGGTGISIGSTILTLPITINSTAYNNYSIIGHGSAFNGTSTYPIHITGNGQMFFYNNTGATNIVYGNNFSSSNPFTWAAPHTLYQQGFYEIA